MDISSVSFYGLQSKRRNLHIKRSLKNYTKRLRKEKIPETYHSSLLGPSARWQVFYRQQEALDLVKNLDEDLHVFAFECWHPDKQSGQRQFLAATCPVFWHYYQQLEQSQRYHYEVIPEGCACKLYFDLEFQIPVNQCADGVSMVDILIEYVNCWLKDLYGVDCSRDKVLELSASTDTKFSRHLIFQPDECAFQDNISAGRFVRAIFSQLEDYLHRSAGEDQSECQIHKTAQSPTGISFHIHNTSETASRKTVDGEEAAETGLPVSCLQPGEDVPEGQEGPEACVLTLTDGSGLCVRSGGHRRRTDKPGTFSEKDSKQAVGAGGCRSLPCTHSDSEESGRRTSPRQGSCDQQTNLSPPVLEHSSHCGQMKGRVQNEQLHHCAHDQWHFLSRETSQEHKDFEHPLSDSEEYVVAPVTTKPDEVEESIIEVPMSVEGEEGMDAKVKTLCDRVFKQFQLSALRALFVKDTDGRDTCFADLGVYTKNRNFRLYKSCKLGKTTPFEVAEQNTFIPGPKHQEAWEEREIFCASLITNASNKNKGLEFEGRRRTPQPTVRKMTDGSLTCTDKEHMEGNGRSPYPEVDDFISSQLRDKEGAIRRWVYFPASEILNYDIIGYRFCHNVQRQHRSNNIKLVADLRQGVWYQKCYDPDCQAISFKSKDFALPPEVLPSFYMGDAAGFEDVCDANLDDDDDGDCLHALQVIEQDFLI